MSDPASILKELQPLFQSLERAKVVYYMHVAATCVFVYDHLTTFADEVDTVWPAPWRAGKIFFLVERYVTWPELILTVYMELADIESHACHAVFTYIVCSINLAIVVTEMILILRTWALWGGKQWVLVALALLLVATGAADLTIVADYVRKTVFIRASDISPSLSGCAIKSSTRRIAIGYMIVTAFELAIVVLTGIRGVQQFRIGHSSNLITSLYRDGFLYFVYLFVISLGNVLCIYLAPFEFVTLIGVLQRSFNAILSCKIIMHLQAAARLTSETAVGIDGSTILEFAPRGHARFGGSSTGPSSHNYTSEWFSGLSKA
ncbi:hypothetical protein AURDEDRAFT_175763 [Auricularia subglabra TFB-10046 SS5]|uniref:DUF6533 domain-containing protein n=1 Tax=Auricularia subglabra (strain TFB-10046 / SS5) TaxID=717982 RepID=J0WSP9_AURST|nr:hypothetical protein AURDEDRAFT_175763 [Auricularia subglabra TFB-10046 SS5]